MSFLIAILTFALIGVPVVTLLDRLTEQSWWWEPHRRQRRWRQREVARRAAAYELDGMEQYPALWKAERELEDELNAVNRLLP